MGVNSNNIQVLQIPQLPAAGPLNGTETVVMLQGGRAKRGTSQAFADLISAVTQDYVDEQVAGVRGGVVAEGDTLAKLYAMIYTLATFINGDDINLDTIKELSDAIKTDQALIDFISSHKVDVDDVYNGFDMVASGKVADARTIKVLSDAVNGYTAAINGLQALKVDKVAGKGLIANDEADRLKLLKPAEYPAAILGTDSRVVIAWDADKIAAHGDEPYDIQLYEDYGDNGAKKSSAQLERNAAKTEYSFYVGQDSNLNFIYKVI